MQITISRKVARGPGRNPKKINGPTKATLHTKIGFIAFCFLLSGCHNKAQHIGLLLSIQPESEFLFLGTDLLSDQTRPSPVIDYVTPSTRTREQLPEISGNCIQSETEFFYAREAGWKIRLCAAHDFPPSDLFEHTLDAGPQIKYASETWNIEVKTLTDLKKKNFDVLIDSYDGLLAQNKITAASTFKIALPVTETNQINLPATFPSNSPALLLSGNEIFLIYNLPQTDRYLIVSFRDDQTANRVLNAVRSIPDRLTNFLTIEKQKPPSGIFVSELLFSTQGASFIELSANANTFDSIRIATGSGQEFLSFESFFLAGSAYVMRPSQLAGDEIRFQSEILGQSIYSRLGYSQSGSSKTRSLSADLPGDQNNLSPSIYCRANCDSMGLSPLVTRSILDFLPRARGEDFCSVADLDLSEFNPFGIYQKTGQSIDAGGKFLEFKVRRSCKAGKLLIRTNGFHDPGIRELRSGTILLIVADSSLFASADVVADSSLRDDSETDQISLLDLETNEQRVLLSQSSESFGNIVEERWLPRSPVAQVHSIVMRDQKSVYHGESRAGIRPDLLADNAMSPGSDSTSPTDPSATTERYALNEIYPAGSRDTASIPDDEFFEIKSQSQITEGRLDLEVTRKSDGKTYIYKIPPPPPGTTAYMHGTPHCFASSSNILASPELYLPNEASSYVLKNQEGTVLSSVEISNFSLLDSERRSLAYHDSSQQWRITDVPGGTCAYSNASPGVENSFLAFLLETTGSYSQRNFKFYSSAPQTLRIRQGLSLQQPVQDFQFQISDSQTLSIDAIPGPRSLFQIDGDTPLYSGEIFSSPPRIFIHSVAPTPLSGEEEWVRICSMSGFNPVGTISIHDSNSSDTIVPANARSGFTANTGSLDRQSMQLAPGECAILIDPDYIGQPLPLISGTLTDAHIWTIQSTTAIGNGLSSGEPLRILENGTLIASYGLPDATPFSIPTSNGSYVMRRFGSLFDDSNSYGVQP